MKKVFLKIIGGTMLAILMVTMFTQIFVSAQEGKTQSLEGVWNVQVTRLNCQTGAAMGSGPAILTFVSGGTMHDFGTGRSPATRSPGYGVWSANSNGQFSDAFQFFIFHSDGTFGGRQIVREQIQLSNDGNTFTNTATSEILDVNGNVTANRCSSATGTRFQ